MTDVSAGFAAAHVGAHVHGHQHGVSNTNLYKFRENVSSHIFNMRNNCMWPGSWRESLQYVPSFYFQILDFNLLNGFDFLYWSILNGVTLKTSNRVAPSIVLTRYLYWLLLLTYFFKCKALTLSRYRHSTYTITIILQYPCDQEPITRSLYLPYKPYETTFVRIFLFLETAGSLWFARTICHIYSEMQPTIAHSTAQLNLQNNTIQCTMQYVFLANLS